MPTLEEAFAEVAARHLAGAGEDGSPGAEHRLRFARERWREGARTADYLAGRYPEVVAPGATLLDLGCGNGGFALPFAERGLGPCWLLDVHPHEELLALQRRIAVPALHLVADGTAVPLPDASVDLALCVETLEHLPAPRAVGREVARVLRPGGICFLTTPARLRYLLAPDPHYEIRGLLLLPDALQRRLFEGVLHRGSRYAVEHTFWSVAGIARLFPGLSVAEVTSRRWAGPLRRLDWDWVVLRKG